MLRLRRNEPLEIVPRELAATAADLSVWRDAFLDDGAASLRSRSRDGRDETIARLRIKLGDQTMNAGLSQAKVDRVKAGGGGPPLGPRRL